MVAVAGEVGATLLPEPHTIAEHGFWFGEDQGRYILAVADSAALLQAAAAAWVPAMRIGQTGGGDLTLPDGDTISLATLRAEHERFFPAWMEGPAG